jgi:WD40 repeat protein
MSLALPTVTGNPFVGPRAFQTGEHLYARERETQRIVDLLIAERIVLLYSPSGAGKTSLINAALIPELVSERFQVSPVVRVAMDTPASAGDGDDANRYVLSTLLSLEEGVPPDQQRDVTELRRLTIDDYLRDWALLDEAGAGNELLLFDQFEEVLTADATDEAARHHFFSELGDALRDRGRWALFAMREEFVAGLDPYVALLPTKLRTRVRLDLLEQDAARRAIQKPAMTAGREITDEAAQRLVDELRLVNVQRGEERVQLPGPVVEPVQLQVVCSRLWDAVGSEVERIEVEHVEALGDVERTLGDYYADRVAAVATATAVNERWIRDWFDDELITSTGFRAQLPHGPQAAGAAEAAVVAGLEDAHLIRSENRRGARWVELAHDRLVEPVREDNARWRAEHLSDLQRQAARWHAEGRKEEFLLSGGALDAAADRIAELSEELTSVEQDFWDASRAYRRRRRGRLAIGISAVLGIALVASLAALAVALNQSARAADQARVAAVEAERASEQEHIARSRQLAINASTLLDERPETAMLLAVEGVREAPTHEALSALAASIARPMTKVRERWTQSEDDIASIALSADGGTIVAGGSEAVSVWDVASGEKRRILPGETGDFFASVAISPDGERIAATDSWGGLRLWDADSGELIGAATFEEGGWVDSLVFSPDGTSIVTGGSDLRIWDGVTGERRVDSLLEPASWVTDVAFSPDGATFVTGDEAGMIRLWDASSGRPERELWVVSGGGREPELSTADGVAAVRTITFDLDGQTIGSGGDDGVIRLWDAETGQLREQLTSRPQRPFSRATPVSITSLAFGRDGALLVAGANDGTARFWDVRTGAPAGASVPGDMVAMNTEGNTVVAATNETLGVWEMVDIEQPLGGPTITLTRPVVPRVEGVAFSPDNHLVAAGNGDGSVQIWELTSGAPRWRSQAGMDDTSVLSVAVSQAGDLIASGGWDGAVRIWDAADGLPRGESLTAHDDWVRMVVFSPDGTMVASASDDRTVRLWDVASMEQHGEPLIGHEGRVLSVAYSPNGDLLASAADDGTVRLWDVATAEQDGEPLTAHDFVDAERSQLAFSPDGTMLASGGGSTVGIWDLANNRQFAASIDLGKAWSLALAFSPDGGVLAAATDEGTVQRWDVGSGQLVETLDLGAGRSVASAAFSSDGSLLVTGGSEVRTWDMVGGDEHGVLQSEDDGPTEPEIVDRMAFHPDGSQLVTASGERVELRNTSNGEVVGEPVGVGVGWVSSVAFTETGDGLLIVGDETLGVWDIPTGQVRGAPVQIPAAMSDVYLSAGVSPDGALLAIGGEDGTVQLWTTATGTAAGESWQGHEGAVTSLAFDPAGEALATGGSDGTIRLWDLASRTARGEPLDHHGAVVTWVAFDPQGGSLASGDELGGVRLWDVAAGDVLHELRRGDGASMGVASLAVGDASVVAIDWDGSVQMWDPTSGDPQGQLTVGGSGWVTSVTATPDARHVAIADADGSVRILPTDPARWIELACETVRRNLSQADWEASFGPDVPYRRTCPNHPDGAATPAPGSTPTPQLPAGDGVYIPTD